ncbi:MAG: methylenetetrahydrofolate reductase [NAD(P)H] [Alphaproteobacteria bacterium]|nr:methylenetetrahydrofolate reductase [NAD(P)H] [Alphaproteobacteria bacterium]
MTPLVSFEFFPPKTEAMEQTLWQAIQRLAPLNPRFVSVTYGAGGSTRARTHATVRRILEETSLTPAAHLTCIGASRAEIDEVASGYARLGVRHLVALRGDIPPEGVGVHPDGYRFASELVEGLAKISDFDLSVAAYPEVHPEATSAATDLDALKRKIDAGATRAITNFFFEAETYLRFVDRARRAGIVVPIVPGILPVTNFAQVVKFAGQNKVAVPPRLAERFAGLDGDPETRRLVAVTTAAELCQALEANGVNEFHFYTLNRAELTYALCHLLGVRPAQPAGQAA